MSVRRLDPVQPASFAFTAENIAWAKTLVSKYPAGKQASAVIPLLWRAQEQHDGWVSRASIECVAKMLDMASIRVLEVATFYTMFQLSPVGKKAHIQVCGTTPCMLRGAEDLIKVCQSKIHHDPHHLNADGSLSWEEVECLGACVNAPMIQVFKDTYEDLTPAQLETLIDDFQAGRKTQVGPQNGRQQSMALGGATSLIDKSLYTKQRNFKRVEAPPPPPAPEVPAPVLKGAPTATGTPSTPSPAQTKPAAADIRPVSVASVQTDMLKTAAVKAEAASAAPGTVMTEKAQAETGIVRATKHEVVKSTTAVKGSVPSAKTPKTVYERIPDPPKPVLKSSARAIDGRPELLKKPQGRADDLKLIWGVGPALEKLLNKLGIWHFDQIANWNAKQLGWVDEKLEGFKGRGLRDDWIKQSKKLATGWRPENSVGDKPTFKSGKK